MLCGDQVCAFGDGALHACANAEDVFGKPAVEIRPAKDDGERGPPAERHRRDPGENVEDCARVEYRRIEQRPQQGHQRSAQTAIRRSTYLLYSPNRVRKLGSVRTPSVTSRYFEPRTLSNS